MNLQGICPPFREKKRLNLKQVGIITKRDNAPSDHYATTLTDWLQQRNIAAIREIICAELDLIIVLGGDGSLLHIAEKAAKHGIPVLGINFGSLGFLSDITEAETLKALDKIRKEEISIENRLMLQVRVLSAKGNPAPHYCLNDVVIAKNALSPLLNLQTSANDEFITTYKADGLIFSTPTGSTAYNLSAGGPLVYPGLATITVTPICPFMLSSRPVILPADKKILTSFDQNSGEVQAEIIVDGKSCWQLQEGDRLEILPASHPLQLAVTSNRDYFTILRNKLHWGKTKTTF